MRATMHYHVSNWRKVSPDRGEPEEFRVRIGDQTHQVRMRALGGDIAVFYEVFAHSAYRVPARKLSPESVRVVIDAGAHIGLSSLFFAAQYPNARIVAIEPDAENAALLAYNTRMIADRLTIVRGCLAAAPGKMHLVSGGFSFLHRTAETGGLEVEAFSLDSLRERYAFSVIDLLKIDIEGAEKAVFEAGIGEVRAVVAELHGDYDIAAFSRHVAPRTVEIVSKDTCLAA